VQINLFYHTKNEEINFLMTIKKKILIIDNSNQAFTGKDINGTFLRGTETSLILLAEEFVRKNIDVFFVTKTLEELVINGVNYINFDSNVLKENFNLAIAVSNANLFKNIKSTKKAIFSVSNQTFEKFVRKKQLLSTYKFKPTIVTLCDYQFKKRSFITSPFGKVIIPITVDNSFINEKVDITKIPNKNAIYNIRSNRNLDELINIWMKYIFPKDKSLRLNITPNLIDYLDVHKKHNIFLRTIGDRSKMIEELKESRVLLYLGHKSDIFTLTVEEAIRLCVPVVTYGTGSIKERVIHGVNGFIAKNENEFSDYTLKIMNDDELLKDLKMNMFKSRLKKGWSHIADKWIKIFLR
tara:strand:+ start:822 stop:1880 length:1059 start_codon:yes stop_codon:yes gene_type:complete